MSLDEQEKLENNWQGRMFYQVVLLSRFEKIYWAATIHRYVSLLKFWDKFMKKLFNIYIERFHEK